MSVLPSRGVSSLKTIQGVAVLGIATLVPLMSTSRRRHPLGNKRCHRHRQCFVHPKLSGHSNTGQQFYSSFRRQFSQFAGGKRHGHRPAGRDHSDTGQRHCRPRLRRGSRRPRASGLLLHGNRGPAHRFSHGECCHDIVDNRVFDALSWLCDHRYRYKFE